MSTDRPPVRSVTSPPTRGGRSSMGLRLVGMLVALGALVILLRRPTVDKPEQDPLAAQLAGAFVAGRIGLVTAVDSAVIAKESMPIEQGRSLPAGRLTVRSGHCIIDLFSGTRISVDGPATITLLSPHHVAVSMGQILARVPAGGPGFTLEGPRARAFVSDGDISMRTDGSGNSRIQAIHKPVALALLDRQGVTMKDLQVPPGRSARVDPVAPAATLEPVGTPFPAHPALANRAPAPLSLPRTYDDAVRAARPVGYWSFNATAFPADRPPAGTTFGPLAKGAFSIELWFSAVEFTHAPLLSLVSSADGSDIAVIELRAMEDTIAHRPGVVRFTAGGNIGAANAFSIDPYHPGKWQHVVAVRTPDSVALYLDGARQGLTQMPTAAVDAALGLKLPAAGGGISHLAIYDRALDAGEIKSHSQLR